MTTYSLAQDGSVLDSQHQTLSKRFALFFSGIFICLLLSGQTAFAEEVSTDKWDISADKIVRYDNPNSIVATGNVLLVKKERVQKTPSPEDTGLTSWQELLGEGKPTTPPITAEEVENRRPTYQTKITIKADWIVYDVERQTVKAKGDVSIVTEEDQLYAREGFLKLVDETGTFTDAVIIRDKDALHLEGQSIEKTGLDTYRIVDGWAITCKLEEGQIPPWSFSSANTDIRQGGYAVLKHARFNIKNIPVLYSPYLIVPVKNTRQTGFLFPEFSQSTNNGFGFNLPLFINISDSADATFFPEFYTKRGVMPGLEFRYVADENSKGTFIGSYMDDQLSDPSETEYYEDTGYTHDNSDRYWLRGKADHTWAGLWQSRLDVDLVSDEDYLREFSNGYTGFKESQKRFLKTFGRGFNEETIAERQNSFKVLRTWKGMSLVGQVIAIDDANTSQENSGEPQAAANDAAQTEASTDNSTSTQASAQKPSPLWTLPNIDFSGSLPSGFADVRFNWNADYVNYWREEGVGGSRIDLQPSLSSPLPLGPYLESRAELSLRNTFYQVQSYGEQDWWQYDDTQNRFYGAIELETATTLERDFASAKPLRHQIRPYLKYLYIPDVDQSELPQFDKVDMIDEQNTITYGVDNFFDHVISRAGSINRLQDYAQISVEQSYNISQSSDEPFSDIRAKLRWLPLAKTAITYKTLIDVYGEGFHAHTLEADYRNSRGDFLSLDYSFKEAENIEQLNASAGTTISHNWLLEGGIKHSISADKTTEAVGALTYQAPCWSVKLQTTYKPEDTSYFIVFNLANIGIPIGTSF